MPENETWEIYHNGLDLAPKFKVWRYHGVSLQSDKNDHPQIDQKHWRFCVRNFPKPCNGAIVHREKDAA